MVFIQSQNSHLCPHTWFECNELYLQNHIHEGALRPHVHNCASLELEADMSLNLLFWQSHAYHLNFEILRWRGQWLMYPSFDWFLWTPLSPGLFLTLSPVSLWQNHQAYVRWNVGDKERRGTWSHFYNAFNTSKQSNNNVALCVDSSGNLLSASLVKTVFRCTCNWFYTRHVCIMQVHTAGVSVFCWWVLAWSISTYIHMMLESC